MTAAARVQVGSTVELAIDDGDEARIRLADHQPFLTLRVQPSIHPGDALRLVDLPVVEQRFAAARKRGPSQLSDLRSDALLLRRLGEVVPRTRPDRVRVHWHAAEDLEQVLSMSSTSAGQSPAVGRSGVLDCRRAVPAKPMSSGIEMTSQSSSAPSRRSVASTPRRTRSHTQRSPPISTLSPSLSLYSSLVMPPLLSMPLRLSYRPSRY